MASQIFRFTSSGAAYDAAMSDDEIKTGDVLVVESERVVGLADTWPVAVTVEGGELHHIKDGLTLFGYGFDPECVAAAVNEARRLKFSIVNPE